jgi:hypothetical protein
MNPCPERHTSATSFENSSAAAFTGGSNPELLAFIESQLDLAVLVDEFTAVDEACFSLRPARRQNPGDSFHRSEILARLVNIVGAFPDGETYSTDRVSRTAQHQLLARTVAFLNVRVRAGIAQRRTVQRRAVSHADAHGVTLSKRLEFASVFALAKKARSEYGTARELKVIASEVIELKGDN